MPNHVHTVFGPFPGWHAGEDSAFVEVLYLEGSQQAAEPRGEFWEPEYYDHLIRSEEEFHHYIEYVASNPEKAGLEGLEVGVGGEGFSVRVAAP